jgi:hypothetical protein
MSENEVYTEQYKGFTIRIEQDIDGFYNNPFETQDGNPPLAVLSYDHSRSSITEYATQYGNVNEIPDLTREQIKANLGEILKFLEAKSLFELRDSSFAVNLVPIINDRITEAVDDLGNSDRLEALADVYKWAGIPALLRSVRGYSQGDYWEVLAVATPKFQEACGNDAEYWQNTDNLKGSIDLFGDWVTGNCYGYAVEDEENETIDSCYGFFGDYDSKYNALSEAKSFIDYEVEQRRRERIEQLKVYIKNRVPLQIRMFALRAWKYKEVR